MKKLLSLVAALALVGGACGGSSGPDPADDPKGALVSAFENLEGESSTFVFTIVSTPESLDALASQDGGAGMNRLRASRTSFVIAHRLSTIRGADLIVVMEHGRIVEQGSHQELLSRDGPYFRLYNSQFAAPAAEVA